MAGADLANLVNEAAVLAARRNKTLVDMQDFEDAKDKVMLGVERRSLVLTEAERKLTAYHEAGHAIVAIKIPGSDPVHKVTIVPRGRALGLDRLAARGGPPQLQQGLADRQSGHVLRRPGGRGDHLRRGQGDHRGGERHRARDGARPSHGHAVRYERARSARSPSATRSRRSSWAASSPSGGRSASGPRRRWTTRSSASWTRPTLAPPRS